MKEGHSVGVSLLAGGTAGVVDALCLHPVDTIKVRLQLETDAAGGPRYRGLGHAARSIIRAEGPLALYKGLGPVLAGIVPKMSIRFTSFHRFKALLQDKETGKLGFGRSLLAGLGAGVVESLLVVTPQEVVKIRLQDAKYASRYSGQLDAMMKLFTQEGPRALYRGTAPTMMRQGMQSAFKFACFYKYKDLMLSRPDKTELTVVENLLGGAMANTVGAIVNTPLDVVKTRIQRQVKGEIRYTGVVQTARLILKEEGPSAFLRGVTARIG